MSKIVLAELIVLSSTSAYLVLNQGWSLERALLVVGGGALVLALLLVMVVFGVDFVTGTSEERRAMWNDVCSIARKDIADLWASMRLWK